MRPFWVIDKPNIFEQPENPSVFEVKGWVASLEKIDKLEFADARLAGLPALSLTKRPDVELEYPHLTVTGFQGSCDFQAVRDNDWLGINLETGGQSYEIVVPVHRARAGAESRKAAKMDKLLSRLRCPFCGGTRTIVLKNSFSTIIERIRRPASEGRAPGLGAMALLYLVRFRFTAAFLRFLRRHIIRWKKIGFAENNYIVCSACCAVSSFDSARFNFLPDAFIKECGIRPSSNVSDNKYDGVALNYIYKHWDGLILDCGAGLREKCYENVVNFEIVAYDSTDVLGVVERLPFQDGTFEAVFSFAVLEHVKDPFAAAREMIRVLKPGGTIYCQAPFLAPLHGYPNHYFNMSRQGLNRLFEGLVEVQKMDVLNFGQPVFALSWFLNLYTVGLPPELQQSFKETKVGDWLEPGSKYLGKPLVRHLSGEVQEILACVNYMIATKKQNKSR